MIAALLATPLLIWDLSLSDGGFVAGGSPGQWAWEVPAVGPGGVDACWGTRPGGTYLNEAEDTLEIPIPALDGVTRPVLAIEHWYAIRSGDAGTLEVDDGSGWQPLEPIYGYPASTGFSGSSDWTRATFDLSAHGSSPRVRLVFTSDAWLVSDGWYVAEVGLYDGDVTPPHVGGTVLPVDTQDLDGPYRVEVEAEDDVAVETVDLVARFDGGDPSTFSMEAVDATTWAVDLPGQPPDTTVTWYVVASDGTQSATWPADEDASFRVYLAAPEGLSGPEGRVVGSTVRLTWDPPDSPHEVTGYVVHDAEGELLEVETAVADAPVAASGTHTFQVAARYEAGVGDLSAPLDVDVRVPVLEVLEPGSAWQGDRIRIEIEGEDLYLHGDTTSLSFGPGVTVESLEIIDVDRLSALIEVDGGADVGLRDLTVGGAWGEATFADVFTVKHGTGAPAIAYVLPSRLEQGDAVRVLIEATQAFGEDVTIDPGEGLVVTSEVAVDGQWLGFDLLARGDAPPGVRTLVIDDGARLWSANIEVEERTVAPSRQCAPFGPVGGWALLVPLALARRRR